MRRRLASTAAALCGAVVAAACGGGSGGAPDGEVRVVVSVPRTASPWVGEFVVRGAELAAAQINDSGGVTGPGGEKARIVLDVVDHGNSVQRAQANARRAVDTGAALLVTDGVGAVAVAGVTDPAALPVFVTFEGGTDVVDEEERPTLFRLAPANKPMATRLADYLAERRPKLAVLTDDSSYGRDGRKDLAAAVKRNQQRLVADIEVPSSGDPAPQVLEARESGADTLVVWARAPVVAAVLRAARSRGWNVPVFTGPTGEDPLVRQQLADHPEWVDGLTFVSFRITSEVGPEPFAAFRTAYERRFGRDEVGVAAGGRPVVMPPDWAMYSYDALYLLKAALQRSKGALGQPLLDALNEVSITGANGDERSFLPKNHEGVSPDDMYFARFEDMRFAPVKDDPLSVGLPAVPQ